MLLAKKSGVVLSSTMGYAGSYSAMTSFGMVSSSIASHGCNSFAVQDVVISHLYISILSICSTASRGGYSTNG